MHPSEFLKNNNIDPKFVHWAGKKKAPVSYDLYLSEKNFHFGDYLAGSDWWAELKEHGWQMFKFPRPEKPVEQAKNGLRILHVSMTPKAYAPARLVDLTNKYTDHSARFVQIRTVQGMLGNPLRVQKITGLDNIKQSFDWANVIHWHGKKIYARGKIHGWKIDRRHYDKATVLHYHGTPERETYTRCQIKRDKLKLLLSTPEMVPLFLRCQPMFFPNLIDEVSELYTKRQPVDPESDDPIRVCHHFSLHPSKKDTDVFQMLQRKWQDNGIRIRFSTIGKGNLDEILRERSENDIVFDHLQGYYGLISIEAMAQGIVVVNGASSQTMGYLRSFFGEEPPFVIANKKNLHDVFSTMTRNRVEEYSQRGIEFMNTHWSGQKNIHKLIKIYEELL